MLFTMRIAVIFFLSGTGIFAGTPRAPLVDLYRTLIKEEALALAEHVKKSPLAQTRWEVAQLRAKKVAKDFDNTSFAEMTPLWKKEFQPYWQELSEIVVVDAKKPPPNPNPHELMYAGQVLESLHARRYAHCLQLILEMIEIRPAHRLAYELTQRIFHLRKKGGGKVGLDGH